MTHSNHIDLIELPTESIEEKEFKATKHFFSQVFDWSFQDWSNDYADTSDSGLGSSVIADSQSQGSMPLVVVFVDNLEAAYKKVVDANGVITKEIFSFPGGRRFHFKEPSGNELAAWSK